MHVKNHMALWFLWFLWFLCVRYSGNPLYKPFCSFLVFVDLLWFLCGSSCGFWSRVVFGSGLRVRSCSCGFCGSVVLSRCRCRRLRVRSCSCGFLSRVIVSILEIADKDINVPGYHGECLCGFVDLWVGGLALDARCRRLRVLLLFLDC